jgi:hypothetical protein
MWSWSTPGKLRASGAETKAERQWILCSRVSTIKLNAWSVKSDMIWLIFILSYKILPTSNNVYYNISKFLQFLKNIYCLIMLI